MKSTSFVGGSLSFKGDNTSTKKRTDKSVTKKKKKKSDTKHTTSTTTKKNYDDLGDTAISTTGVAVATTAAIDYNNDDDEMTEVEKRVLQRRLERETKELQLVVTKSHRERIEEFNDKLSSQTEHNDIPRVSAAGNG